MSVANIKIVITSYLFLNPEEPKSFHNLKNNSISYKKILFIYLHCIHSINLFYISIYAAHLYKYDAYIKIIKTPTEVIHSRY